MKIAILVMALVFNSANLQQSFAFVNCGYGTLYYSEELSEDVPIQENIKEEPTPHAVPAESGSRDVSI